MVIKIGTLVDELGVDHLATDFYDFPLLRWNETRPNGASKSVVCFISGDENGDLLFASNGGLLTDAIYRRRRWEKLVAFRAVPAVELYYTGVEKRLRQEFMNQYALLRVLAPDDGVVFLADFADDHPSVPMHLNYAIAPQVELVALQDALHRRFILQRRQFVDVLCDGEFKVPKEHANDLEHCRLTTEADFVKANQLLKEQRKKGFFEKLFGS